VLLRKRSMSVAGGARRMAAVVCAAALACGCSGGETAENERASRTATKQAPMRFRGKNESYAGSTRTTVGAKSLVLLEIPRIGSLSVSCPRRSHARIVFRVFARGATAAVVVKTNNADVLGRLVDPGDALVAPARIAAALYQTWHITPVTPTEVRVAVVSVAAMPAPAALGGRGCFASARAEVTTASR
jgi:hypothetical protein